MDRQNPYFKQVELLVRILPVVGSVKCFTIKGESAINLFYRDMPRLSVDIDLVYLPLKGREESLQEISDGLLKITAERYQHSSHYFLPFIDFVVKIIKMYCGLDGFPS